MQGLGFSGAGAGLREYAGDDDDVIARNKRLRGRVYGTEAHADVRPAACQSELEQSEKI